MSKEIIDRATIDLTKVDWQAVDSQTESNSFLNPEDVIQADPSEVLYFAKTGKDTYAVGVKRNASPKEYFYINIPDTHNGKKVDAINANAFSGCDKLLMASIPGSIETIGDEAFKGCSSLGYFDELVIPSSVTSIGDGAFDGCLDLKEITLPVSVSQIGKYIFADCRSLRSVALPQGISKITWDMFMGCESLNEISIPSSVKIIAPGAFQGFDSLYKVNIPEGVEIIGGLAFYECGSLDNIVLPDSLKVVEAWAFNFGNYLGYYPRKVSVCEDTIIKDKAFPEDTEIVRRASKKILEG
jgi:hypothetical protein